jgi:hypothetical protein
LEVGHQGGQLIDSNQSVTVSVEIVKNFLKSIFLLVAIGDGNEALSHEGDQLTDLVLEGLSIFVLSTAPGLLHHSAEVVIRRSG